MVNWHRKYAAQGLVIVEIDGGEYEKLAVVRASVAAKGVQHPVLWDEQCQNTKKYDVTSWPAAYLLGVDGKVLWEGNPSRVLNRPKKLKPLLDLLENELRKSKLGPLPVAIGDEQTPPGSPPSLNGE